MITTSQPRLYGQVARIHATEEVLRQATFGWPLDTIHRKVAEATGETASIRTTQRDLRFLERLGRAEHVGHGKWRAARNSVGPAQSGRNGAA